MASTEPWEVAAFKPEFQAAFAQAMRKPASPELGLGGHSAIQTGNSGMLLQGIQPKPYEDMFQCWDLEFQEFLEAEDFPWEDSRLQDGLTPWENTDAFLASFQQVALACRWPRKEWVNRLLPSLDRDGEEAFRSLDDKDQGDFWKVKMAILQKEAMNRERKRQQFRRFCYQEANGPREVCFQLQRLCHQWLKAEWQTKEQILEQLILEQFLAILPKEMQAWVREQGPVTCNQAVTMAESFLRKLLAAETQEEQHPQEPNDVAIDYSKTKSSQQDRELLWTKKDIRVDSSSSRRSYPNNSEVRRGRKKSLEWECLEQTECWPKRRGRPSKASLYQLKQEVVIKERRRSERLRGIYPENRPNYSPHLQEASKKFCKASLSPETTQGRTKICPENRPDRSPPQEEGSRKFCKASLSPETPQSKIKVCQECGQSFSGISSLTRHQARCHTKEKRHACCFCSRAFCWKSDLARHESMHTGRKPHECQFCGEGFYRKWQRKKHELVHEKIGKRL